MGNFLFKIKLTFTATLKKSIYKLFHTQIEKPLKDTLRQD